MTDTSVTYMDEEFWALWRRIKPLIQKALDRADEYTIGDVLHFLHTDRWQAWYTPNSVACTRIAEYPEHRTCVIVLAAGELEEVRAAEPQIVAYAQDMGCKYVEIFGRKGWERVLPGYSEQFTVLRKVL